MKFMKKIKVEKWLPDGALGCGWGCSCGESRAPHECQIAAGLLDRGWLGDGVVGMGGWAMEWLGWLFEARAGEM